MSLPYEAAAQFWAALCCCQDKLQFHTAFSWYYHEENYIGWPKHPPQNYSSMQVVIPPLIPFSGQNQRRTELCSMSTKHTSLFKSAWKESTNILSILLLLLIELETVFCWRTALIIIIKKQIHWLAHAHSDENKRINLGESIKNK